jgi:hypothetical protein
MIEIAVTELGVTVTIIGMLLPALLPQQLFGHAFAFEFLAYLGEIRFGETPLAGTGLGWE